MTGSESSEKKLNIMFASHTYIGGPFVVGSHHLAREFAQLGHRVMHVSTSITPLHLLQLRQPTVLSRFRQWLNIKKQEGPVINCVPFSWIPWQIAGRWFRKSRNNWFVRFTAFPKLSKLLDFHRFTEIDLLLIDQPVFAGIQHYLKAKVILYRPTDIYKDMQGDRTVEAAERDIVSQVHGVVATSDPVYQNIRKWNPELPGMVMENGVEFSHFSNPGDEPEELIGIPRPRAIYIGAVDSRLDLEAIKSLAEARRDLSIVIIGPRPRFALPSFGSNVYLLGAKPYSRLPAFLHQSDLALLPLSGHAANAGRSPMKLYEYAAAGLPTVVTATPELLRRDEHFLYFYKDKQEFIDQVNHLLEQLNRNEISKAEIVEAASKQSWETKAEQMLVFGLNLIERVHLSD
ncbi:glycosyltransferase [Cohnella mopanensis]|uniref:glycosyltransferase n=1 Tax=Cohnella mopanensis TaxID=2911966 RepID=UPI001EF918D6|nr:glycosyltransferase [Cohnella mopanensis]